MNASTKTADNAAGTATATNDNTSKSTGNVTIGRSARLGELSAGDFDAKASGTIQVSAEIPAGTAMIIDGKGNSAYVPVDDLTSIWNKNWFRGVAVGAAAIVGGVAGHFGMNYFNRKDEVVSETM